MRSVTLQELHRRHDEGLIARRFRVSDEGILIEYENGELFHCAKFGIGNRDRRTYAFSTFIEKVMGHPAGSCFLHFRNLVGLRPGDELPIPDRPPSGEIDPFEVCEHGQPVGECELCDGQATG